MNTIKVEQILFFIILLILAHQNYIPNPGGSRPFLLKLPLELPPVPYPSMYSIMLLIPITSIYFFYRFLGI